MRCVCSHVHTRTRVNSCVCVFVWLGKLGGRSNRSRTRTIPTTRTQTRTRAEPNRTAPHRTTLSPFRRSDTRQTVANRLTSKRVLGVVCSPNNNNNKNSSYDCETHTHTLSYVYRHRQAGRQAHAHTVKWHVHTYLNMMRNFNFPWLIHMFFDCHTHIVVNLVNLSLDPNSGWLFRLDFMARRPRSGYHTRIWFIIVFILPMCDCNVNQLNTHFVYFVNFVSLSTISLNILKGNYNLSM